MAVRHNLARLAGASLAVLGAPAVAQTAAGDQANEEIVVTANRREQTLVEVSASVSALSGAQLQRQGIDSFERLASEIPGLTLNQPIKNRSVFNIRGLATNVGGGNTQDPVSVYINDAPVTESYGAVFQPDLRLFDIDRVEVLRGPQGTLFGSGALAGTIRIITAKPDTAKFAAAGRVDVGVTEGGHWRQRYDALVNVPIVADTLAVRATGYYRDEQGWVENQVIGTRNDTIDWGARGSILWTPGSDTNIGATVMYQNSDPKDSDAWNPRFGKFQKRSIIATRRDGEFFNANLALDHDFGFATLSSSSTYQRTVSSQYQDRGPIVAGLTAIDLSAPWRSRFVTQEVRLVSDGSKPFSWILGGFYVDRRTDVPFLIDIVGLSNLVGGAIPTDRYFDTKIGVTSNELAGYADATYAFDWGLKVFGGLRVFRTEAAYREPLRLVLNFGTLQYDRSSFENITKDNGITWRAGVSYEPFPDSQVYASVSTGYRVGQANPNQGPSPVDPTDAVIQPGYGADRTTNYEIGAKAVVADGRLNFNLALFYIVWKDIQQNFNRVSDFRAYIDNTGTAVSQGLEFQANARPIDPLDLGISLTIQDAKITKIDPANALRTGVQVGDRLPGAIDAKIAGHIQYTQPLAGETSLYVRVDAQYTGSSPNYFPDYPLGRGPNPFFAFNEAYSNVDAQIGYQAEKWNLTAYVENATNNDAYIINDGGASANPVTTLRPRTFGLRFGIRY